MGTQVERELALIQAYVAAERERCAKIADQFAKANAVLNDGEDGPGAMAAAQAIAAQIRS